jgi:hypothetical protein
MTDARDLALPTGYTDLLGELKDRVRAARTKALRTVNTQLIELYWSTGQAVRVQQEQQGWGSQVIKRLSEDLRKEFPDEGASPIVQRLSGQLGPTGQQLPGSIKPAGSIRLRNNPL